MRLLALLLGISLGSACHSQSQVVEIHPTSEKVLAARKLQRPLDQHLCKAKIYPARPAEVQLTEVAPLSGRGPTLTSALEALCREADGHFAQGVTDIYYWHKPTGWAAIHEVRGTAVRFTGSAPPAPPLDQIQPAMPTRPQNEPKPSGEK